MKKKINAFVRNDLRNFKGIPVPVVGPNLDALVAVTAPTFLVTMSLLSIEQIKGSIEY
jgi:hypothetical protein